MSAVCASFECLFIVFFYSHTFYYRRAYSPQGNIKRLITTSPSKKYDILTGMKLKLFPAKVEAKNYLPRQTVTAFRTIFTPISQKTVCINDSFITRYGHNYRTQMGKSPITKIEILSNFLISCNMKSRTSYGRIYQFLLGFDRIPGWFGLAMSILARRSRSSQYEPWSTMGSAKPCLETN